MTDTSQRIGRKLVTCLAALDRRTNLGLTLGVDGLVLAACLVLAALVSGQTVAELALTVPAVTGGLAALAVAIYGVGEAGAQFGRAMGDGRKLRPVCFFDEKRAFTHRSMAGPEVFPVSVLRVHVVRHRIASIASASPLRSPLRMRALTHKLVQASVRVRWIRNLDAICVKTSSCHLACVAPRCCCWVLMSITTC